MLKADSFIYICFKYFETCIVTQFFGQCGSKKLCEPRDIVWFASYKNLDYCQVLEELDLAWPVSSSGQPRFSKKLLNYLP